MNVVTRPVRFPWVKAMMPCVVYVVACVMKVETFSRRTMLNMIVITAGVCIASYGELNFNWTGMLLLLASIACEAVRVVSIQLLLTSADIKLNSVTTLYYVSPACLVFLCLPFAFIEMPKMAGSSTPLVRSFIHSFIHSCIRST